MDNIILTSQKNLKKKIMLLVNDVWSVVKLCIISLFFFSWKEIFFFLFFILNKMIIRIRSNYGTWKITLSSPSPTIKDLISSISSQYKVKSSSIILINEKNEILTKNNEKLIESLGIKHGDLLQFKYKLKKIEIEKAYIEEGQLIPAGVSYIIDENEEIEEENEIKDENESENKNNIQDHSNQNIPITNPSTITTTTATKTATTTKATTTTATNTKKSNSVILESSQPQIKEPLPVIRIIILFTKLLIFHFRLNNQKISRLKNQINSQIL